MKNLHDSFSPQQEWGRIANFLHSCMFGDRLGTVGQGHYSQDYKMRTNFDHFLDLLIMHIC